jgi:hypothetical protein
MTYIIERLAELPTLRLFKEERNELCTYGVVPLSTYGNFAEFCRWERCGPRMCHTQQSTIIPSCNNDGCVVAFPN